MPEHSAAASRARTAAVQPGCGGCPATAARLKAAHPQRPGAALVRHLRHHVRQGGILAYPTESCFGLGCDPRQPGAVARVLRLKRRPRHKGVILIAASFAQLAPFVAPLDASALALLGRYWPGPYTFLLPASRRAHRLLRGRHDQIAVRVTDHPLAAGLCAALGTALVSTSANLAGRPSLRTARACAAVFGKRLEVLPGKIGNRRKPSTIIDLASGKVLR